MNPLKQLNSAGQAVWFDTIRRGLITSGELRRMIEEDGLSGITANPTIFEKAIAGSTDYDLAIRELVDSGKDVPDILERLMVQDIQDAADLFRPTYDRTEGADGFVSIEVSPKLAHDTAGTIAEARRFHREIGRPNVMIKVPATAEGIPAIRQLLSEGINVNITLLFAVDRYEQVMEAYLAGMEALAAAGKPLARTASVASFFVSRIDTNVDKHLARLMDAPGADRAALERLQGKPAIANAKIAYQRFKAVFGGGRFAPLQQKGARVQRILWASTSTKSPKYSDVYYVEPLIGPDSINTMPIQTYTAFKDHGRVRMAIEDGLEEARQAIADLARVGIELADVTRDVENEGVELFSRSFDALIASIACKRDAMLRGAGPRLFFSLHGAAAPVLQTLETSGDLVARIWACDPLVWKKDAAHHPVIKNRLGWLHVADAMADHVADLTAFADTIRQEGIRTAVVLGMGGSSLCPEVCARTFGSEAGYPSLLVLDSTDPSTIRAATARLDLPRTLFIVSSKSGTTTESASLGRYFEEQLRVSHVPAPGRQFIAITDPGTPLEREARTRGFRRVFLNPPDIGGRYSALSYFGLVPAALIGIDLARLLDRAGRMAHACAACVPARDNPGLVLGTILGALAARGRDKITFVASPAISSFGTWVEQLLAESTGKDGKGLVPVEGEPSGSPDQYGSDRLFVVLRLDNDENAEIDREAERLERAGEPVVRISLADRYDLGAEFFGWEFATAVAGAMLGVDPFDEPNVQESKDNTRRLLEAFRRDGRLAAPECRASATPLAFTASSAVSGTSADDLLKSLLASAAPGDYAAIMAYLPRTPEVERAVEEIRLKLRNRLRVATTVGFGPRFLHSTGQLHKGGKGNAFFLQITYTPAADVPIPGEPYSFGTLFGAQSLGDYQALAARGRRAVRVELGRDVEGGLRAVGQTLECALATHK